MKILLAAGLLCLGASANAATLYYNNQLVTAIENLDIGGTLYNVDFDYDGGYGTFGGEVEFWATEAEGMAAVDIINALFIANNVFNVYGNGIPDCEGSPCYTVKFGANGGALSLNFGGWYNVGPVGYGSELDPIATSWSVAVPVPAAVWLFSSGLALLGFRRLLPGAGAAR